MIFLLKKYYLFAQNIKSWIMQRVSELSSLISSRVLWATWNTFFLNENL